MEEIDKRVNLMFEMVEGSCLRRRDKIKKCEEGLKERFITNLPVQVQSKKKKLQDESQDKENETSVEPNPEPEFRLPAPALRPVRTAKLNASKNLREPLLNNKMRQPGGNEMLLEVKEEPLDQLPEIKRETRSKKIKKEKPSVVPPVQDNVQRKSKDSDGRSSKDSSIEVVVSNNVEIVELSDGEGDKMPPPALPVPKTRRARTKKKASNAPVERPIRESRIKKEKLPVTETSSARSSQRGSGESLYEDAHTGEPEVPEERPVVANPPDHPMNATFDVAKENEKETDPEPAPANSSLMTEDNSIEVPIEEPKKAPPPQKKKPYPHELFNPCVQSPLRTKVEAFERHAAASALPIAKGTPSHVSRAPRLAERSASTSKLTQNVTGAKKKSTKALTQSATKATTRSASAEDNKRGLNALQLLAEEKRKKREERHKQAQQAREMREREKEERHRRLMMEQQEREEKFRQERLKANKAKMLQEQEQKNRLEELQRSQQKLRLMKAKESSRWGFDMLHSDDSTDDEDKKSNKRPPAPSWSVNPALRDQLAAQEFVNPRIMDELFMTKPMSVDLKEVFPDIDPRNLHRNSSVVWKTPPRFSETPNLF